MENSKYYFNQKETKELLSRFFKQEKASINSFGRSVNQTFEAYVLASVIEWYRRSGWVIKFEMPRNSNGRQYFKLKFSTRGAPKKYTYIVCEKENEVLQIHHQLRVETKWHARNKRYNANICCDVAVIKQTDISGYSTDAAVSNKDLVSFAEAKHMSAFAELVANFIGMVHELKPDRLKRLRIKHYKNKHLPPFLYASGILFKTAKGMEETIEKRKYDIDIYSFDKRLIL